MTITWTTFTIRLLIGFFLAVGIGIERQWLKKRAVLKTNVLVTLGSAMFTMLSIMTPGDASPTRIAAQIVSGVGFLGGGVILREGGSVKGTNTAATIWCAAAIGSLVGSGFLVPAYLSTLAVIGANLLSKPLEEAFKQQRNNDLDNIRRAKNLEIAANTVNKPALLPKTLDLAPIKPDSYHYCCELLCFSATEHQAFDLIKQFAKKHDLTVVKMQSKNVLSEIELGEVETEIKINFTGQGKKINVADSEEMIRLLKIEAKASSVSWQLLST
jgi:putative Mg2+ transporter-C (MgtC) family protein